MFSLHDALPISSRHHGNRSDQLLSSLPFAEGLRPVRYQLSPCWDAIEASSSLSSAAHSSWSLTASNVIMPGCCHIRSEEHTSELQSLMRISYAVSCLKKPRSTCQKYKTQ